MIPDAPKVVRMPDLSDDLDPTRPSNFTDEVGGFGWSTVTDEGGRHHYTTFTENGGVQGEPEKKFRAGLRGTTKVHRGDFKLIANQQIITSNVTDKELPEIKRLLAEYKLGALDYSGLGPQSSACVTFTACGMFRRAVVHRRF